MRSTVGRCVGLVMTFLVVSASSGKSTKDRLYKHIFDDYNKIIDPPNYVNVSFEVLFVCASPSADGKDVKSTLIGVMAWTDERLRWDPVKYGGISSIRLPHWKVWKPDIMLYNTVDANRDVDGISAILSSAGEVLWIPRMKHTTQCSPHADNLRCKMEFGSWLYDNSQLNITGLPESVQPEYDGYLDIKRYLTNCPRLENISVIRELRTYPAAFEHPWVIIVYNFDLVIEQ